MKTKTLIIFLGTLQHLLWGQTPQVYKNFNGETLNLYAWNGTKTMILSSSNTLDQTTMQKWAAAMDGTYNYYKLCTNRDPTFYTGVTYLNGLSTIAEVPSTCGAGCGYLGWTGIELQTTYFNNFYNTLHNNNQYSQEPFYEFGRNFWFYDNQLKYKSNDPIVTGYAVFMRFMAIDNQSLAGANFNSWTYPQFESNVRNLFTTYMSDANLSWNNTLGIGTGISGSGLGATDLFASFCFKLHDLYGENWVRNVWKFAGTRPSANTTQDAVDNFIIAASQAANINLASTFISWKWPVSANLSSTIDTLLSTKESSKSKFSIYPNPARDILNFSEEVKSATIFSIDGKIIRQNISGKAADVAKLPNGTYLIKAITKSDVNITSKFIKE
ncbi:MAG: hypothetical protein DI529_07660 [Chryseobacterium sp.]|nr:MAG: hypothetical protein DI529_07660 [Chryseobacterium sp.]